METDVVCPDCGKVIAPAGTVENSLRCRCSESRGSRISADQVSIKPKISVPIPIESPAKDDTDTLPAENDSPVTREKKCYVCGKELAGRTRLKDHLGRYWCKECAAADERAKKRQEELRCPDCGRVFPDHKLVYFQVTRVCKSCYKEREKKLEKKITKAAAEKIHEKVEWSGIKRMAIIAGVLILLGTIGYFMSH